MTTREIAEEFTALCKAGRFDEAGQRFWADNIVSREPMEGDMAVLTGRAAVEGKSAWWYANHEVHGGRVEGPYVHGDQFILRFTFDITPKASGKRMSMDETGLYTVRDGKVVEERFFYGGEGSA